MRSNINEKPNHDLIAAELSALYELSSISFSESEEDLIDLAIKKATRLFSPRYLALFTGSKDNLRLITSWGFRHPDEISERMRQAGSNQFCFSSSGQDPEGHIMLFMEQMNPISRREYRLYTIFARRLEEALLMTRSIKEQKRTEAALRESEERYRTFINSTSDIAFLKDENFRYVMVNNAYEKYLGKKQEDILGKTDFELLSKNLAGYCHQSDLNALESKELVLVEEQDEDRVYETWKFPVNLSEGKLGIGGYVRDVTERRRLEKQLQQAQKMEAISTLAGGIAHEFNNALSVVMSSLDMLEVERPGDEIMSKYAELIKSSSLRMSKLTRQLLAYARGGKYKPEITSLVDFIDITLPIIQHIVPSEIRISTILSDAVDKIEVDITQMQMALSAIVTNAVEAIEGKGCISISSGEKKVDWELVRQHPDATSGRYVYVAIEDNGKGMDKRTVDLLFEPFFTMKFQGRGLGMAAAYGIVKNHNGFIEIDSQPEKGTVVSINLPTVETETTDSKEPKVELVEGTGTILVVEDEEIIMDICRTILERLGYHVLEAKTGREAVDLVKRFDGAIDGVLLDVGLPDMKGETVYEQLMAVRPHLKCVVCTGYAVDDPYLEVLIDKAHGFIQKPYSLANLSATLKAVLTMEQGMDE